MQWNLVLIAAVCATGILSLPTEANTFFSSGWRGKRFSEADENAAIIDAIFESSAGGKVAKLISSDPKTHTDACRMISQWNSHDFDTHNIPEFESMLLDMMCQSGYENTMDPLHGLMELLKGDE